GSARAARLIGAWSTLAWVMLIGLAVTIPLILVTGSRVELTPTYGQQLAVAGTANTAGLLLGYFALRRGKVAVVGAIVSAEGPIGGRPARRPAADRGGSPATQPRGRTVRCPRRSRRGRREWDVCVGRPRQCAGRLGHRVAVRRDRGHRGIRPVRRAARPDPGRRRGRH